MKIGKMIAFVFRTVWKINPLRLFLAFINAALGVINEVFIGVLLFQCILNAIFGQRNFRLLLFFTGVQVVFVIIHSIYTEWYGKIYKQKSDIEVKEKIQNDICRKCIEYDMTVFTNSDSLDKYVRITGSTDTQILNTFDSLFDYGAGVAVLLLAGGFFAVKEPFIGICIVICFLVDLFLTTKKNKLEYERYVATSRFQRKEDYFVRVNYVKSFAEDNRITNLSHVLLHNYDKNYEDFCCSLKRYAIKAVGCDIGSVLNKMVFGAHLPYILIGLAALTGGKYTAGDIAVLVAAMIKMRVALSNLAMIYPKLKQNMLYMKDYQEFMDYEPAIQENEGGLVPKGGAGALALRNVSFGYDKGRMVLKNISMEIGAGEKIAIVGYNGAGKSTLVKILLRLCLPEEGEVLMDGKPAETYSLKAYRGRFATAFQESNLYALTAAENVLMDVYTEDRREAVEEALRKAGIRERLPEGEAGLRSEMTKEFSEEGIELSGGQTQKLALSRVYAEEKGIIILDEPSSALDPVSESRMYQAMLESAEGKTLILISHRLSLVREADRIYYLEDGRIEEAGSHEELLGKNGKYAALWHVQADRYADVDKGDTNEKGIAD